MAGESLRARAAGRSLALDILRIFAALWVVSYHWTGGIAGAHTIPHVAHLGYMGVDLFFMLSGAVIIHTALGRSWSDFAQRRFLRLFPVYFLATTAMLVWMLAKGQRGFSSSLLIEPTGINLWTGSTPIVTVAWTLLYEVNFYILVAVVIVVRKRLDTLSAMRAVQGFVLLLIVARWLHSPILQGLTLGRFGPLFALGAAIGLTTTARELRAALPTVLVAATLGYLTLADRVAEVEPRESLQAAWAVGILAFALAFLVWDRVVPMHEGAAPRLHKAATTLSLMTYPIYLLHLEFGLRLLNYFAVRGVPPAGAYAIAGAALLLVCWVLVRFVEPPSRRLIRRAFGWGGDGAVRRPGEADLRAKGSR